MENKNIKTIVKNYGKNIRSVINSFSIIKNTQDVEQEVYIKVWKNFHKNENKDNLWGWLKMITINACKDHIKSKSFTQSQITSQEDEIVFVNIKDSSPTPDNIALLNERQKFLINAIENLGDKFKEVVLLHDVEGFTHDEISKRLGCPVGTVKSRLFKARKQLYEQLFDIEKTCLV